MAAECSFLADSPALTGQLLGALLSAGQRQQGRLALAVEAEFAADKVGGLLGHEPVGSELTSGDGDEAPDSVAGAVVEKHDASADVAPRRIGVVSDQRPYAGIRPDDAGRCELRDQLAALGEKDIHLAAGDFHVVALLEGHLVGGCADPAHHIAGYENVGIGGLAAAVNYHLRHPVAKDQQRSLRREHPDVRARHLGDVCAPNAGGIDRVVGPHGLNLSCMDIADLHSGHGHPLLDELHYLPSRKDIGAVKPRVEHVQGDEPEGVDRRVGHLDGADDLGVHRRLHPEGLFGVEHLGFDTGLSAALDELCLVGEVIFGERDEKAFGLFDAG